MREATGPRRGDEAAAAPARGAQSPGNALAEPDDARGPWPDRQAWGDWTSWDDALDEQARDGGPELDTTGDEWLDALEARPENRGARSFVTDTFTGPLRWVRRLLDFTVTTPGRIIAMMTVLTLALFAAGWAMSQSMAQRQDSLNVLINSTEPMSNSAHVLFTSLSQADTVSTTSFISPGMVSEEDMKLYLSSLDRGVVAANEVLEGTVDADADAKREEVRTLVTQIQRDVPVYAGLMERAKTNQRMGNPVGVAYMSEASGMMRERMLDDASSLFELSREQVGDEMARLSSPQWIPLSGLVAALGFLVLAQLWLWKVFRRRLNKGFLAATAMMIVAITWVSVSNYAAFQSGVVGFEKASNPWQELTTARINAQETRTDEIFALLRRQSVDQTETSFNTTYGEVQQALDAAAPTADPQLIQSGRDALEQWSVSHNDLVTTLNEGRFDHAIDILTDTNLQSGQASSAAAYSQLDSVFSELINNSRGNMREYISASLDATRAVSGVVLVLTLLSIVSIWLGIRRRLREYL
ncbi:hypothetical protein [Corynebacterium sp. UBA2622]|uniref:hypothetical protein n=1 Tax=Corynebacterium sp. UBA2622 TaxID=1946393 RepID=UPI0025C02B55|nr:hypothetical protein [Corynebacterium sp. UBA2622]